MEEINKCSLIFSPICFVQFYNNLCFSHVDGRIQYLCQKSEDSLLGSNNIENHVKYLMSFENDKLESVQEVENNINVDSKIEQNKIEQLQPGSQKDLIFKVTDELYDPCGKKSRKKKKQIQNEGRNIIPNIIHQIIYFVQKFPKTKNLVQKILNRSSQRNASVKRFFLYQKLIKERLNNYVNMQSLDLFLTPLPIDDEIMSLEERLLYAKVSRIIIKEFIEQHFIALTLTSTRIKRSNRILHLKGHRAVIGKIKAY